MQKAALDGYADVSLLTPFVHRSKADIVTEGARVGTPFADTWSCYILPSFHMGCGSNETGARATSVVEKTATLHNKLFHVLQVEFMFSQDLTLKATNM
jgi:7-cyano-7-deazaguanine synthase in queuosine biosynthesis